MFSTNVLLGYPLRRKWQISIPLIIFSAFLYTIAINLFITNSRAFQSGIGAFAQLLVYIFPNQITQRYFSILYFGFNLPLFIIFATKIRKRFIFYTFIWLCAQVMWAQIFASIPIFNNNPNPFGAPSPYPSTYRYLYGLVGAIIAATSVGIAFFAGASTGGTDIVVYYLSLKHNRSIGLLTFTIGLATIFISIIIQYATGHSPENGIFYLFFGVTLFISLTYIFISAIIINFIYPIYRKIQISISSTKIPEIIKSWRYNNFNHAYSVHKEISGHTGKDITLLTSVMFYLELGAIVRQVKYIDPKAWISVSFVHQVIGKLNVPVY